MKDSSSTRREFIGAAAGATCSMVLSACKEPTGERRAHASPRSPRGRGAPAPPPEPGYLALERSGALARLERELWSQYRNSRCCPRKCEKDRARGLTGECKSTARVKVSSVGPHHGEEAPLVGTGGSGTIFFSNCNLLCCFCQNWEIAHRGDGSLVTEEQLAKMMLSVQDQGCHNVNLVTPTHFVPSIVRALRLAIKRGLRLPLVYNTGGYDSIEVIKKLRGVIDVYMPDFKFQDPLQARRYLFKAEDYPWVAAEVIKEMHRQVGQLRTDERGIAQRGLILRHLVMPNNVAGTDTFVKWVARELGRDTYLNLMSQYRPAHEARRHETIARPLTRAEWAQARSWAEEAGLTRLARG